MLTLARDRSGSVALLFAAVLPIAVGAAAYAVDAATLYVAKNRLQTAADAASVGAALVLTDTNKARTRAINLAVANVPADYKAVTTAEDVQFGSWDASTKTFSAGAANTNAVRVTAKRSTARGNPVPMYFASIFGRSSMDLSATAVAVLQKPRYCVIALDSSGAGTFSAGGNGTLSAPNCGIYVNSSTSNAATTGSSTGVIAQRISVVGGYTGSGFSPTPTIGMPPITDPFASLPQPAEPSPCVTHNSSSSTTLNPGCYNSIHLSGSTTTKLNPGIYFIKDGTFSMKDSHSISGGGVLIYLNKNSNMSLGSSGTISLSAPTSGIYKDVLIFHSRDAFNKTLKFGGSSQFVFSGHVYAPTSEIVANGTANVSDVQKSGSLIGKRISFTGASNFSLNQMGSGVATSRRLSKVSLVD